MTIIGDLRQDGEPADVRETTIDQADRDNMGEQFKPKSNAECLALLFAVLDCLDEGDAGASRANEGKLSLAGAHVQQAIELIQALEKGHA